MLKLSLQISSLLTSDRIVISQSTSSSIPVSYSRHKFNNLSSRWRSPRDSSLSTRQRFRSCSNVTCTSLFPVYSSYKAKIYKVKRTKHHSQGGGSLIFSISAERWKQIAIIIHCNMWFVNCCHLWCYDRISSRYSQHASQKITSFRSSWTTKTPKIEMLLWIVRTREDKSVFLTVLDGNESKSNKCREISHKCLLIGRVNEQHILDTNGPQICYEYPWVKNVKTDGDLWKLWFG